MSAERSVVHASSNLVDTRRVMSALAIAGAAGLVVLVAGVGMGGGGPVGTFTGLLWALASAAVGAAAGFLFGIPRVLQDPTQAGGSTPPGAAPAGVDVVRYQVNTNLEQISDWLTKIIVGVGLIELRSIPERFESTARFFGAGLGDVPNPETIAGSTLVYFLIVGFLLGYLTTRLYLAGAFSRADALLFAGMPLSPEEASEQQELIIDDLAQQYAQQRRGERAVQAELPDETRGPERAPKSVLWVDDRPSNNGVLIDRLTRRGIHVSTAVSTDEALKVLGDQDFDVVVTDMGRREGLRFVSDAGLRLLEKLRKERPELPLVIYTSPDAVARHRQTALDQGARAITASPTELMEALGLL